MGRGLQGKDPLLSCSFSSKEVMSETETPAPEAPSTPPKKKGCLFYGGMGGLGLIVVLVGFSIWGYYAATAQFRPHDIEPVVLTAK